MAQPPPTTSGSEVSKVEDDISQTVSIAGFDRHIGAGTCCVAIWELHEGTGAETESGAMARRGYGYPRPMSNSGAATQGIRRLSRQDRWIAISPGQCKRFTESR